MAIPPELRPAYEDMMRAIIAEPQSKQPVKLGAQKQYTWWDARAGDRPPGKWGEKELWEPGYDEPPKPQTTDDDYQARQMADGNLDEAQNLLDFQYLIRRDQRKFR